MSDIRPVKLSDVIEVLELPDDWDCYVDRRTGEIITVTENEAPYLDGFSETENLPEWQQNSIQRIRATLKGADLVELPTKFDVHEWDIMRRFSEAQNGAVRDELLDAIHGKGAFRMFRAVLDRLELRDDWFRFRDQAFAEVARDWLQGKGIPFLEE